MRRGIYTATITTASLRMRESGKVAELLLQGLSESEWQSSILEENVLQIASIESRKRISRLLRARLEPLGEGLWKMVCGPERRTAVQAAMAGAIKNSRILGDFMDFPLREQRAMFSNKLNHRIWNDYIASCRGRDPEMPSWSDGTLSRLRSTVFCILSESGYLNDTRTLRLQNVFVDDQLAGYLETRSEHYVLRCLRVAE